MVVLSESLENLLSALSLVVAVSGLVGLVGYLALPWGDRKARLDEYKEYIFSLSMMFQWPICGLLLIVMVVHAIKVPEDPNHISGLLVLLFNLASPINTYAAWKTWRIIVGDQTADSEDNETAEGKKLGKKERKVLDAAEALVALGDASEDAYIQQKLSDARDYIRLYLDGETTEYNLQAFEIDITNMRTVLDVYVQTRQQPAAFMDEAELEQFMEQTHAAADGYVDGVLALVRSSKFPTVYNAKTTADNLASRRNSDLS